MRLPSVVRRLALLCVLAPALATAQYRDLQRYRTGLAALDALQWQAALDAFKNTPQDSPQAPGALYWKAFALLKLRRGAEAQAAVDELRQSFPKSGWMADTQALDAAIHGGRDPAAVKETTAEAQQRALAERVRNDPEHAVALLRETALQPNLPGVRQRAFYDLSRDPSQEARDLVIQVARGSSNPDLQLYAINQLGRNNPKALPAVYQSVGNEQKFFIVTVLTSSRANEMLAQIAAGEPSDDLRFEALSGVVDVGTDAQLDRLLKSEKSADVKRLTELAIESLHKWLDQQLALLRTASDAKARRSAAIGLSRGGDGSTTRALLAVYASEKDYDVKGAIVFTLAQRKEFGALTALEEKETDQALKQRMIQERRLEQAK